MIPGIDAKNDPERIGAGAGGDFLAVSARVRGYGGGPGWSLVVARVPMADGRDMNVAVSAAAEVLAKASRYDSGRDPDALSWQKVSARGLAEIFATTDSGLALDAAAYAHAGHGGRPEVDAHSLWVVRDPLSDFSVRAKDIWSKAAKGEPSIAYGRMPLHEARRLIAGRIARRLTDWRSDPGLTPVTRKPDGTFRIDASGATALPKKVVAAAIAAHPQSREAASAAALTGSEIVTLFQRSVPYVDLRVGEAARGQAETREG